jgi:hypothetical protein
MQTQLLCTFCSNADLEVTLKAIVSTYEIAFDTIYVLENMENSDSFCCTYNINNDVAPRRDIPPATISLHRKKSTNTLYTINALNLLIADLNNGNVDKSFKVPWDEYKNTILVTAYNKLKKINTKLHKIVKVEEVA